MTVKDYIFCIMLTNIDTILIPNHLSLLLAIVSGSSISYNINVKMGVCFQLPIMEKDNRIPKDLPMLTRI